MRHVLLSLALVAAPLVATLATAPAPAHADRIDPAAPPSPPVPPRPAPPPRKKTAEERIKELEQRVRDLEKELADAKQKLGANTPPPRPMRPQLDSQRHYRVPLDDSPALGPSRAPIIIVAALQFPEPYTHKAWPTLTQLLKENRDVRIVVKSYIVHPRHARSSIAACAAAMQGELERMEQAIYDAALQPDPTAQQPTYGLREIPDGESREIARALRLNLKQYDRDLATCEAGQQRDIAMLGALGQGAVPVFWINGRPLSGAQPIESFNAILREEREAWKKAKAAGARLDTYYDQVTAQAPTP